MTDLPAASSASQDDPATPWFDNAPATVTVAKCHPFDRCQECGKAASYLVITSVDLTEAACGAHVGRAIGKVLYAPSEVLRDV